MQVQGKYKRFWGSDQWSIKIDFSYEDTKTIKFELFLVEFKNDKNGLFNSFEVTDLCSCVSLMMKFAEGFGIAIFDRRLVNWMEEYFDEHGVKISGKSILNCLNKDLVDKIDVKVKKLTIINKSFTDILEYNPEDLATNFADYYQDENWKIGEKQQLSYPMVSNHSFLLDEKKISSPDKISITNNYNGKLDIFLSLINDKEDNLTNITIEEVILPDFKPLSVNASLIAPDKTVLGIFQPLEINQDENGLKIVWKINELKINHRIEIEYILVQRVPFILKLKTDQDQLIYLRYVDVNSDETNKFLLEIPAIISNNNFDQSKVESINAYLPIELETQTILYLFPHYILKIIDLGFFQRITFSDLFIETLFTQNIQLEGAILPVLTLYESFVPQIGSKLIKKIFRNHSYTNPIIMYNLETSASNTLEIIEEYPTSVGINLFSFGNQSLHEEQVVSSDEKKYLIFYLNATNDTILFSLSAGELVFDLERALNSVKDTSSNEIYEIFQNINVESIVDQTNKNYLDFKNFKIISNTISNKIRLRSYSLKIFEKELELESHVNQLELDKAFETLKQTNSLAALKEKIRSGYTSSFTTEGQSSENESIESTTSTSADNEINQSDEKETVIIATDELSEENKAEIQELDAFINDFGKNSKETADEVPINQATLDKDAKYLSSLSENLGEMNALEEDDAEIETQSPEKMIVNNENVSSTETKVKNNTIQEHQAKKVEEQKVSKKGAKKLKKKIENQIIRKEAEILEFNILFDEYALNEQISSEILDSDSKVLFVDKNEGKIDNFTSKERPEKIYVKIPKNDRFLILLVNPRGYLSVHIYSRWKLRDIHKFKILLSKTKGLWHIRIQLLESGQTTDFDFQMD